MLKNHGNSCYINAALQLLDHLTFSNLESDSPDPRVNIIVKFLKNKNPEELFNILHEFGYYTEDEDAEEQKDSSEFLFQVVDLLQNNGYINVDLDQLNGHAWYTANFIMVTPDKDKFNIQHYLMGNRPKNNTQNILIWINRFRYANNRRTKTKQVINPDKVITFENGTAFSLSGCIVHEGASLNQGHYTYLTFKNGEPDEYINDTKTIDREDPKNKDKIIPGTFDNYVSKYNPLMAAGNYSKNGYVYLYTRIPGSTSSSKITPKEDWNCNVCTFLNEKDHDVCTMCHASRTDGTKLDMPCGNKRARSPVKKAAKTVKSLTRSPVKKAVKSPVRSPVKKAVKSPTKKVAKPVTAPSRSPARKAAKPVTALSRSPIKKMTLKPVSSPIKKIRSSPKKKVTPQKSIMPLINIGNSCFINAALQLVDNLQLTNMDSNMTDRDTQLLNTIYIQDIFKRRYKKIKNPLAVMKNLKDFFNNRNQNNELKDILKAFYRRSQEDSHEFLIVLIHLLENYTKYKGLQHTGLFCENNTTRYKAVPEEYEIIELALVKNQRKSVTLQDCLSNHQMKETLDDPIREGNCTEKNITIVPYQDSTNAIFQLKRFNNALTKDSSPIIPNPTISLFANRERTASVNYQLTGCIIHTGGVTLNSGHYTYLSLKNGQPDMYINDSRISKYNPQKDPSFHENGYVYLYTKV
jgi:ubiquitin C-terminal hydrolase